MPWPAILTAIKTRILTVPNVGQVHDYIRWSEDTLQETDFDYKFVSTILGASKVLFWMVTFEGFKDITAADADNTVWRRYDVFIEGFLALQDSTATEKTFKNLVLAVTDVFNNGDETLGGTCNVYGNLTFDTPRSGANFQGVGCHYAKGTFTVEEVLIH